MVFACPEAPFFLSVADLHSCWIFLVVLWALSMHRSVSRCLVSLASLSMCPSFVCHVPGALLFLPVPSHSRNTQGSVNPTPVVTGQSLTAFSLLLLKELLDSSGRYLHKKLLLVLVCYWFLCLCRLRNYHLSCVLVVPFPLQGAASGDTESQSASLGQEGDIGLCLTELWCSGCWACSASWHLHH